ALPFSEASCSYVYASHFFEHLAYPNLVDAAFQEVRRILRPGGVLRIVVPDAEEWLRAHLESADTSSSQSPQGRFSGPLWDAVRKSWPFWDLGPSDPFSRSELGVVASYLGCGGGVEAALDGAHQMAFDFDLLKATLVAAGFVDVTRSELNGSCHKAMAEIDRSSSVADASYVTCGHCRYA
ncbi:unnamed protein product, partial [Polarella glacialis]